MMTGYLFRNAQYRRELRRRCCWGVCGSPPRCTVSPRSALTPHRSVSATALPGGVSELSAAGASAAALLPLASQQRGVSGAVLRWSDATGLETLPAGEYIADLEGEVRRLRDALASMQRAGEGRNPLLEDLKGMEPSNLAELTTRAVRCRPRVLHGW